MPEPLLYLVCFGISVLCRVVSLLASISFPLLALGHLLALLSMQNHHHHYNYQQPLVKPQESKNQNGKNQHWALAQKEHNTQTFASLRDQEIFTLFCFFNASFVKFRSIWCNFIEVTMQLNFKVIQSFTVTFLRFTCQQQR